MQTFDASVCIYVKYRRVPFVIWDSFTVRTGRREKSRSKPEKKKREGDSHAEQYRPSDRDLACGRWPPGSDEDPSAWWRPPSAWSYLSFPKIIRVSSFLLSFSWHGPKHELLRIISVYLFNHHDNDTICAVAPWAPSHGHQVDGCAVTRPISNMYSTCVPPNISTW